MLLNSSRSDQFQFELSSDILFDDIRQQYNKVFVQQPTQLISNINDLLYESIQSIDIMALNAPLVKQSANTLNQNGINKAVEVFYKGSKSIHQTIDKRITIRFRLTAGFINYFAMLETFLRYHNDKSTQQFFQPMRFISLYNEQPLFAIDFSDVIFSAIDKLSFDLTNVDSSEKTFNTTWVFNNFDFRMPSELLRQ